MSPPSESLMTSSVKTTRARAITKRAVRCGLDRVCELLDFVESVCVDRAYALVPSAIQIFDDVADGFVDATNRNGAEADEEQRDEGRSQNGRPRELVAIGVERLAFRFASLAEIAAELVDIRADQIHARFSEQLHREKCLWVGALPVGGDHRLCEAARPFVDARRHSLGGRVLARLVRFHVTQIPKRVFASQRGALKWL